MLSPKSKGHRKDYISTVLHCQYLKEGLLQDARESEPEYRQQQAAHSRTQCEEVQSSLPLRSHPAPELADD